MSGTKINLSGKKMKLSKSFFNDAESSSSNEGMDFQHYPQLQKYCAEDIVMQGQIKKRSYLLLRPERHLILFRDGSFAYFKYGEQPILKKFFQPGDMVRMALDGKKLEMTSHKKTYHFYCTNKNLANQWAQEFKNTRK